MDRLYVYLVSLFLFNCVYSASISSDKQGTSEMCGFPPVAEHPLFVNSCSVDNSPSPLKTICDRFTMESDCYFPKQPNFPIGVFMSDVNNGTIAAKDPDAKAGRLGRNCQYLVQRLLMTDEECHTICGSDMFLFCDLFVAMENTLKNYFVQEVHENGAGYQNLDVFVHPGKFNFLFPYPVQESFHVSSTKLEECLKPKENVSSNTITVCSMLGEVAVEFVQTGKNFSMSSIDYFQNVSSSWDPCENLSSFAKSSLPGVQLFKEQEVCQKTCNDSNKNICRTVVLGLQYLVKESGKGNEDGDLTSSEKKLDTNIDKSHKMESEETDVAHAQVIGEEEKTNTDLTDVKSDEEKKADILKTPEESVSTNTNVHIDVDDKNVINDTKDDKGITDTRKDDDKTDHDNGGSETGGTDGDFDTSKNHDDAKNSGTDHEETHGKEGTDVTNTDELGKENKADDGHTPLSSDKETTNENNESPDDAANSKNLNENGDNVVNENEDKDTEKDPLQEETSKEETGSTVTEPSVNKNIHETEKQSKAPGATATYSSSSTPSSTSLFSEEINNEGDIGFTGEDSPNKPAQASDEKLQPKQTVDDTSVNKQSVETVSGDSYEDDEVEGGHFMAYFLVFIVVCVAGYIVFHNKQKIIALVIEGKGPGTGRRPATKEYRRLKTEDVMPSLEKSAYSKNYVF